MSAERLHDVIVEVGEWGTTHFNFRCNADPATDPACHMVCPQSSCEEGCHSPDEHVKENIGECAILTWLENSDAEECILGGTTEVRVPIEYEWHGEGVDWKFAGADA